ncbi:methionyl-tRNA formyltransferase [Quadrisphaera sp. DSM 44207]|uniref:methionyl-tRNA formyltransferase n=1 Tax=Quadrisphaera sp. DSM 44207 TaxID=1881057 RepID=UPI0008884EB0|nr:methionyl-tRNA formyltransferase [Quadrisphaera sp. DSM 44207]SDQ45924.1 methionyl-tRNA formyltransferase [Quadrisphaera sp. DSM 44207]
MRIVFAGTPSPALPSLEALLASRHEVAGVVSRPDAPAGRGRRASRSPVTERALEAGLPVLQPHRAGEPAFLAALAELAPECCPVVAYGALLPPPALAVPARGWVNLHFSLLPAWRGAAPVQRAVMAGDDVTGATTFLLEEGLDTGPVLGSMTTAIGPRETAGDLLARLAVDGARLLVATLDGLEDGAVVPQPQPADGVSSAPKVTVEDARVRWEEPASAVDRRVRGCTPAPGAWTTWRGERLKLGPVEPVLEVAASEEEDAPLVPGELRAGRDGVLVGTATDPVRLGLVQPAGRRAMPAADWARGVRPQPGERFA